MKPSKRLANPRVFGSVARGEDTEESDLDILIDPVELFTLFNLGGIQYRVSELLGIEVDVVTLGFLPGKARAKVLTDAVPL